MKYSLLIIALSTFLGLSTATAQTSETAQTPAQPAASSISPVQDVKARGAELLQILENQQKKALSAVAELRRLVAEGLIARIELEESEQSLAAVEAKIEEARNQIATAARLAEIQKSAELARTRPGLVKPTLLPVNLNKTANILRSQGTANWSIGSLSMVQHFFSSAFGRALPTSAVGQSSTHNRLGWDHRNAVDIALHPDSAEGRALIGYLQAAGIPFLAFRSAIPGVATGPHIHIGTPSHRIA